MIKKNEQVFKNYHIYVRVPIIVIININEYYVQHWHYFLTQIEKQFSSRTNIFQIDFEKDFISNTF